VHALRAWAGAERQSRLSVPGGAAPRPARQSRREPPADRPGPGIHRHRPLDDRALAALRRAWTAPRSPQAIVLVLAAWLVVAANLALWRSVAAIESGPRGSLHLARRRGPALRRALDPVRAHGVEPRHEAALAVPALAAGVSQHYMLDFGAVIDTTMMANVVETEPSEAADLLTWGLLGNVLLVVGPAALWLVPLRVKRLAPAQAVLRVAALFAASLVVAVAATAAMYSVLAPLVRNNMGLRYLPNPIVPVGPTVRVVTKPIWNRPKPLVTITAGAALGPSHAVAQAKPPLVVARRRRDRALGPLRPQRLSARHDARARGARRAELSQRLVVRHQHARVGAVHVLLARQGAVRGAQGRAREPARRRPGRRHGGALGRQPGGLQERLRPGAERLDQRPRRHARGARLCADGECLDEALLEGLDARIAALPEARRAKGVLLVMHQMGSHGPAYGRRSTEAYKRFKPECRTTTLGDCVPAELINVYDNSIAYTDHVLARTIDWAKAQAGYAPALLYVSDHGESLGEYGVFLHGVPYPFAPRRAEARRDGRLARRRARARARLDAGLPARPARREALARQPVPQRARPARRDDADL
jgi:lipid A ethanolaminephosphotransferase